MLKFREVEVFWAVYKCQSVKEAGRLLNISQPAVSMMLKSAEDRFGIKLFDRVGGRVHPTPGARHLFTYTENILAGLQEFERQVRLLRDGRSGSIRVAATHSLAAALFQPVYPDFQAMHPGVRVTVRSLSTDVAIEMVAARRVDFAIVYGPVDHPDVAVEDLGQTQLVCVLRRDHALAKRSLITPQDLAGEQVASYRLGTPIGRELQRALREVDATIDVGVQSTALTAAQLAERGFGVAVIDPLALSGGLFENLIELPFEPVTIAHIQIATPKGDIPGKASSDLLQQIRAALPRSRVQAARAQA